jgi:hypothetical protein
VATIAGLTIRGTATGSAVSDDFFGITAESIRKAKIGGMALGLTLNKDDLLSIPQTRPPDRGTLAPPAFPLDTFTDRMD